MKRLRMLSWIAVCSIIAIFLMMFGLSKAYIDTAQRKHEIENDRERERVAQKALWTLDAFVAGLIIEYSSLPSPSRNKACYQDLSRQALGDQRIKLDFLCDMVGDCVFPTMDAVTGTVRKTSHPYSLGWMEFEKNLSGEKVRTLLDRMDQGDSMTSRFSLVDVLPPGQHLMQAVWLDQFLLLARKTEEDGKAMIQGFWLDWDGIYGRLHDTIIADLPNAQLVPEPEAGNAAAYYRMATLPVYLDPGFMEPPPFRMDRSLKTLLALTWGTAVLASLALLLWVVAGHRLSRRRYAFASAVTHELRTPLTSFQLYTELLAREIPDSAAKAKRHVKTLSEQNQRLQKLVDHVMIYAKLEEGRGVDAETTFRPLDVVKQVVEHYAPRMSLELDVEPVLADVQITGWPGGLEQILVNLLENAIKYAGDAEDKRVHILLWREGGVLNLEVWDHGPGIPRRDRKKCFRPFMKSVDQVSETQGGLGLGLAISRGLAERMGGRLEYVAPPSGGACFRLSLPVT